jgi:hypothetical protein
LFEPRPRPARFDRQDFADALIFIAILAMPAAVIGTYAFALFRRGLSGRLCRPYFPTAASTSPMRALTSFETRPLGKDFSGLKRIVPLAVSYCANSCRYASMTAGL